MNDVEARTLALGSIRSFDSAPRRLGASLRTDGLRQSGNAPHARPELRGPSHHTRVHSRRVAKVRALRFASVSASPSLSTYRACNARVDPRLPRRPDPQDRHAHEVPSPALEPRTHVPRDPRGAAEAPGVRAARERIT